MQGQNAGRGNGGDILGADERGERGLLFLISDEDVVPEIVEQLVAGSWITFGIKVLLHTKGDYFCHVIFEIRLSLLGRDGSTAP